MATPAPSGSVQEAPRLIPAGAPAAETVARVRNMPVGEITEEAVEKSQVLKGFEIDKDRYVTFEPRELAAVRAQTSTELGIAEFVRLQEIDPIFFETSYYAALDRGGEKPYALLFKALPQTDYAAIGSLAMHGREHTTSFDQDVAALFCTHFSTKKRYGPMKNIKPNRWW